MRHLSILLTFLFTFLSANCQWLPDTAAHSPGFEMRYVDQGRDYSGEVRSTVIRRLASNPTGRAVVYIHGFNDYFFQTIMADTLASRGYDFYAVDLRRYGRSLRKGDHPFEVRSLKEYFADIDSALAIVAAAGNTAVTLMGHSTGGLVSAYYMAYGTPPSIVKNLVLNSPFLDWNLGKKEWLVPMISAIGAIFPRLEIPQGGSTAYAESLLAPFHGEWTYNTEWKMTVSPPVTAGWIRAIDKAQKALRKKDHKINVPILLMYSSGSVHGSRWTPDHQKGDAVLDVADIKRYGLQLGPRVTTMEVPGGLHDLILSRPGVRNPVMNGMIGWIGSHE